MSTIIKIILAIVLILYTAVQIWTAISFTPRQMRERYIEGQCNVGLISAAVFYAPAWFLKAFKRGVNRIIK